MIHKIILLPHPWFVGPKVTILCFDDNKAYEVIWY